MKHMKHWLATIAVLLCSLTARAEKVEIDGIWYNLVPKAKQAEVTFKGNYYDSYDDEYSGSITIPATVTHNGVAYSVTSIGEYAFYVCSSLTDITIPEGVTSIGNHTFYGCSGLTDITIPEGVTSIGEGAFMYCSSLTAINIPEGVTSIGEYAFYQCSSLTAINIPEGVTSIGEYAFSSCSSLTSIVVAEGNAKYDSRGGCNAIIETNSNTLIAGCSTTIIPEGVTSIGESAFDMCWSLTTINIPESVTSIGEWAFRNCRNLTAITIPENSQLTSIGRYAFSDCSSLTAITIPEGVTSIEDCAFSGCSNLTAITIPEGVTSIGGYAFYDCSSLNTITIPASVTSIGERAFAVCSSLTAINIPENSQLTSIGVLTFHYCSSLTAITLPEGVTSIGESAFSYCSSLTAITCKAKTPPTLEGSDVFLGVNKSIPVYVPASSVEAYKADAYWREFTNIQPLAKSVTEITLSQTSATLTEGESIALTATISPDDATDKSITWSSNNTNVATVDANGKVTAIAPGTATITATTNDGSGVKASCEVTVEKKVILVSQIILNQTSATLTEGETLTLTAMVTPDNADNTSISWSSSNEDIAMVSSKGKVVAMGVGTATITATANDESGVSASCEVTVIKSHYTVTYIVDGELYHQESIKYGSTITPIESPSKEGYTFSGWSEVPDIMPTHDITIYATFTINSYTVTFKIGDEVISSEILEYGAAIVTPEAPEKEGHTFAGWGEVAATVPASDVTYEGSYTVNTYNVYYYVGEELVHTAEVAYGEAIPEYSYEPTTEGDVFVGWIGETYETMPAHDVTYTANIESGIDQLMIENSQSSIYDLTGRKVTDTENLKGGIYIINGRKVVIK